VAVLQLLQSLLLVLERLVEELNQCCVLDLAQAVVANAVIFLLLGQRLGPRRAVIADQSLAICAGVLLDFLTNNNQLGREFQQTQVASNFVQICSLLD
jgi:hypothetical protein